MEDNKNQISCPHCGQKNTWQNENRYRPFCSARCKLIDLGAWAEEEHRIPSESSGTDIENEDP